MIKIMRNEIIRLLKSPCFYMSIFIIILCGIITLGRNYTVQNLRNLYNIGTLNAFIYSNIIGNMFMAVLAPAVAGLVGSYFIVEDYETNYYKQLVFRTNKQKYIFAKSISSFFAGACVFLISYFIMLFIYFIFDPSPSVKTLINRTGNFGVIYDKSMFLYCLAYIIYAMFFGATYSFLSFTLAYCFKNRYIALGIPLILYYGSAYIYGFITPKAYSSLSYFLPNISFKIYNGQTIEQLLVQLLTIIVICSIIIIIKFRLSKLLE